MRTPLSLVKVGDRLATDTFNSFGLLILAGNTVLTGDDIAKLHLHHIFDVDIVPKYDDDPQDDTIIDEHPSSKRNETAAKKFEKVKASYQEAIDGIKELFNEAKRDGTIRLETVITGFLPIAQHAQQEKDVVSLLIELNTKDDYTYQHSVQVGLISYYIAKWMGQSEEEALLAGKAGYLHDIGKCRIDDAVLQKPGRLTPSEYDEIKQHARYGYEIAKQSGFSEPLCLAALQHHERLNGSGYPDQLHSEAIHPLSKIVAVADIYSAMISNRVYQKKKDLLFVLKEIHRCSFGELDPYVTQKFIHHMLPCLIGKKVLLSNGEFGSIVLIRLTDYFRPLIRVGERFIDLAQRTELEIEAVYI
ncbi:hypothetical protein PAESOLCIP111_05181 [Paenibacillus solanacearum]|uniref:HD-GYP domain-containing protein n=1 Tax=Paenibacillus solanacearum TaxID=2048548 RepID=A0A916K5M9_9BACL|nr:HD-GYP domain-containing protein [Paenibacillus solanacearum]CAG7646520.1 hypothetical protein PAESOLCIP111_05181 [Paenibacillus solanacearum]